MGSVIVILVEVLLRPRLGSMSIDLFEFCNLGNLKESSKNCWTNMGVTAALLLTVDVAMLQADAIEPRFALDDDMEETQLRAQLTYDLMSGVALIYCIWALLECVLYLCYVDPLDNTGAIKFFNANPTSVGGPALSIMIASFHTCVALNTLVLATSGLFNAIAFGVFVLVVAIIMGIQVVDKGAFDPSGQSNKSGEWKWVLEEDKSKWIWFAKRYAKNPKACHVFKRMGEAIKAAELGMKDVPKNSADI